MAGFAWLLAAVSVFLRDVPSLVGVVLLMLFYLTPVFYDRTAVPDRFRWVLDANPVGTIIEAYRALLLGTPGPGVDRLAPLVAVSAGLAMVGFAVFRRAQARFGDFL
jgi:lipopolysaccharide transport system permease protein